MKKQNPQGKIRVRPNPTSISSTEEDNSRTLFRPFWASLIFIITGILLYSNSFDCSFHFDDTPNILDNIIVKQGVNLSSIWAFNPNRFLPLLSFAINYQLGGTEVWGYHATNVLIHILNSCFVYWFVLLMYSTPACKESEMNNQKNKIAFFIAFLFLCHPLATQSVTYIVQRMASMAALFYFASLVFYLKARITASVNRWSWFTATALSTMSALLCKENAYTLPLALLLTELIFFQPLGATFGKNTRKLLVAIPIIIAFGVFVVTRFSSNIFAAIPPAHGNTYTITSQNYLLTQFTVIIKYIQLLLFPITQNLDYDWPIINSLFDIPTLLSIICIAVLLIWAGRQYNKNRFITFGVFWFFITLAVESSIIPLEDVIFEHRTYLPSLGFILLFVHAAFWGFNRFGRSIPLIILTTFVLFYSALTYARNKVWKNDYLLYSDIIEKSPNKARGWGSRGDVLKDQGYFQEALTDYNRAIQINPKYTTALNNRASVYEKLNKYDLALDDYNRAILSDSTYFKAYNNRGLLYIKLAQYDLALLDLNKAVKLHANFKEVYINRASVHVSRGEFVEAIADCDSALRIAPKDASTYCNRGIANMNLGNTYASISDFSNAIKYNPNLAIAYYNRALVYGRQNLMNDAIRDYSQAIFINNQYKEAYTNRANIYIQLKDWQKAKQDLQAALSIDPAFSVALQNMHYIETQIGGQ
jgi:tetratricopeptide (TPR) repeat protein